MRGAPVTMPRGLRSATAFAARAFATLLPAPGASTGVTRLPHVLAPFACSALRILSLGYCDACRCNGEMLSPQHMTSSSREKQALSSTAADRAAADARAAAARTLARGVYDALLPPLGAWLGAAAAKPKGSPSAPSAPTRGAVAVSEAAMEAAAEAEADVVLACRVVSAALLGAQAAGMPAMPRALDTELATKHVCRHRSYTVARSHSSHRARVLLGSRQRLGTNQKMSPPAGGGNKALLDSGVFRALVMLLATGRLLHIPEPRCAQHGPAGMLMLVVV